MHSATDPGPDCSRSVVIVEDHDLLSQSVAIALRAEGFDVGTVHASTDVQLLEAVRGHGPDLVLLDLDLGPGVSGGEQLVAALTDICPLVLVVTGTDEVARIAAAVDGGAIGFVRKASGFGPLLEAVAAISRGEAPTAPGELRRLQQQVVADHDAQRRRLEEFERLSAREQDVLTLLMAGASVDDIARERFVSVATVRTQVRAILTKLGVHTQLAAVAMAHRVGWRQDAAG